MTVHHALLSTVCALAGQSDETNPCLLGCSTSKTAAGGGPWAANGAISPRYIRHQDGQVHDCKTPPGKGQRQMGSTRTCIRPVVDTSRG